MTGRAAALLVVLALVCAGIAGAAGPTAGSSTAKRSSATASSTARAVKAACAKPQSARSKCRRVRVGAGYGRAARPGRALLSPPRIGAPSSAPTPSGGGAASEPVGVPATPARPARHPPGPGGEPHRRRGLRLRLLVLRLTPTSVPAGDLTIYFRNYDVSEHNLWLDPPAATGRPSVMISAAVGEGDGAAKTVTVTPGTWRLYCSLTGHEAMTRDLAVQ